jgi:hypothetical protein
MKTLEKQLEGEINPLLDLAGKKDEEEKDADLDIPEEMKLRKDRLQKIKNAKKVVEERAAERYKKEKEAYNKKMEERKSKEEETGKKTKGKKPQPPTQTPSEKDQYNYTDPESRIMKTQKGFDQCYNGQAAVNEDMVVVGAYCNAHCNDKQEFIPTIESVVQGLGLTTNAVADTGYFSEKNITECEKKGIRPIISTAREKHNSFLDKALNLDSAAPDTATAVGKMQQALASEEGKNIYKKRKQTVEPVFGIIKEILGFRRFSLRGEFNTDCEWSLVCTAYNLKRMFNLSR